MTAAAPPDAAAALKALRGAGDPSRAGAVEARSPGRSALGVPLPTVEALARDWRAAADGAAARAALAEALWDSGLFEARIAAAKVLTQARMAEDGPAWACIVAWVPTLEDAEVADHVARAGARRLTQTPARLDEVGRWAKPDAPAPARRAALDFARPWSRLAHPGADDHARRDRVLGWAAALAGDADRGVQAALARWLSGLARRDAGAVRAFLDAEGAAMAPFARHAAEAAAASGRG